MEILSEIPPIRVRVIVHLDDGRSLVETLELLEDIEPLEEVVLHIWESVSSE